MRKQGSKRLELARDASKENTPVEVKLYGKVLRVVEGELVCRKVVEFFTYEGGELAEYIYMPEKEPK